MKKIELQYVTSLRMGTMWWGKKMLDQYNGTLIACSNYFKVAQRDWQETKWGYMIVYDLTQNKDYSA